LPFLYKLIIKQHIFYNKQILKMPKEKKDLRILPTKQDEESLIKIHENLMSVPCLCLQISPPASGKSTIIVNLVFHLFNNGNEPFFKRVIYVSPTVKTDRSLAGVRKLAEDPDNTEIEIQLITGEHILELEETLKGIIEYLEEMKEEDKEQGIKTALILDDCMAFMKRSIFKSYLTKLCSTYRHIGHSLSIFIACQCYKGVPKAIREMASAMLFGNGISGKTKAEIFEDMVNVFGDDFPEYFEEATNKKYSYCFCDMREQKIYKNFEKLLYQKN
jgi:hypothetical protein